jgi:hypothetical protein
MPSALVIARDGAGVLVHKKHSGTTRMRNVLAVIPENGVNRASEAIGYLNGIYKHKKLLELSE